jgi:putative transcriptional regulator
MIYFYTAKEVENMSVRLKSDVLTRLRDAGYTSYRIRKEKIMGQDVLQKIRRGEVVSPTSLSILCKLLNCQPGDIMEYVEDGE